MQQDLYHVNDTLKRAIRAQNRASITHLVAAILLLISASLLALNVAVRLGDTLGYDIPEWIAQQVRETE